MLAATERNSFDEIDPAARSPWQPHLRGPVSGAPLPAMEISATRRALSCSAPLAAQFRLFPSRLRPAAAHAHPHSIGNFVLGCARALWFTALDSNAGARRGRRGLFPHGLGLLLVALRHA